MICKNCGHDLKENEKKYIEQIVYSVAPANLDPAPCKMAGLENHLEKVSVLGESIATARKRKIKSLICFWCGTENDLPNSIAVGELADGKISLLPNPSEEKPELPEVQRRNENQ